MGLGLTWFGFGAYWAWFDSESGLSVRLTDPLALGSLQLGPHQLGHQASPPETCMAWTLQLGCPRWPAQATQRKGFTPYLLGFPSYSLHCGRYGRYERRLAMEFTRIATAHEYLTLLSYCYGSKTDIGRVRNWLG
ncbi:hypothetical protein V6N13_071776 [Hibiscus sabdariffa]